MLTAELKQRLLNLKPEDITFTVLTDLFGTKLHRLPNRKMEKKTLMEPSDEFILNANESFNKTKITTTAGRFIYNKLIIERDFAEVLGYINETVDGKYLGKIEDILSKALLTDKITPDQMRHYLDRTQWLSKQLHTVICGSFTMETLKPNKKVIQRRDQLLKEHRAEIENGDVIASVKIEKELLKLADETLGKDHGLDLYKSGARGSFGNNYKNISVMKGSVYSPTSGKFDIVTSNFMEGIKKEDIPVHGNSVITAAYPKAIGTATSGYFSKQIIAALQAVVLDEPGTDCGTKGVLKFTIRPSMKNDFLYRYMKEGSKLILLDETNIDKYLNREIQLRSPQYCIGEKLCSKCAGELYEKLKIKNIGLTASRASSTLLNLSMKKFHNTSASIYELDVKNLSI